MKRARGKNSRNRYDDIDVPEILQKNNTKQTVKRTTTKKTTAKKKKTKKKNGLKSVLIIIFAIVAAFLIIMGMGWGGNGEDEGALIPVDMEKGKLNVLLLGVDKDGLRTDAMMLISYDLNEAAAKIMSIPRDTQIKVKDRGVTRKINEIHAMHDSENNLLGPLGSVEAVTALTSVPIHYYIEFSFDAIDEITGVLGPIEYDVPDIEGNGKGMNYDDPAQDLHIHLKPGLQKLKGNQVQQFLRYRKSNSGSGDGSDTSRVERQQDFIKAMIDQKVNLSLVAKLPSIYSKMKKNIKTNFSAGDVLKYAKYLNGLTSEKIETFSLPGESKRTGSGWYYVCDLDKTAELIINSFDYGAENLTNTINVNGVTGTKKVLTSNNENTDNESEETTPRNEEVPIEHEEEQEPEPEPEYEEPRTDTQTTSPIEEEEEESSNSSHNSQNNDTTAQELETEVDNTVSESNTQNEEDGYISLD